MQKITKPKEYQDCYLTGEKIYTEHFIVFVKQRDPDHLGPRVGIAVTKKVGNAVFRNRIKRLIREGFRQSRFIKSRQDVDVVVVAKKGIKKEDLTLNSVKRQLDFSLSLLN
ncbi:ribonuclease P protein component [Desulfothermus okinawensis JCM 13304]